MKVYCSGIGGIGLSAYAAMQAARGNIVLGSDRSDSDIIENLRSHGVTIFLNQDGSNIPSDCDLFVYSEAIPADSPERVRAREFGIPSQSYFHALGELTQNMFVVAVCGTHGKSSTTAMVAKVLMDAGKDPSVIVGTKMKQLEGGNWRKGESNLFVVEACEYRRSFHYLSPNIILMTNVDGDHFDAFTSIDDYHDAFVTFLKRLPQDGIVITHGKDIDCKNVSDMAEKPMIDADTLHLPSVGVPGVHMQQNAQLALAVSDHLHIDRSVAEESLKTFSGTWRRMEIKGETSFGATVIDDYGHHPVEIRATLTAIRNAYPGRRLICIFQPHTHDRTFKLYDEFCTSFSSVDLLIVPDIYDARSDIETDLVDIDKFTADVAKGSKIDAINGHGLDETKMLTESTAKGGDVIVVMGAGDVTVLADRLVS